MSTCRIAKWVIAWPCAGSFSENEELVLSLLAKLHWCFFSTIVHPFSHELLQLPSCMDAKVPQIVHADNLNGVSGAQSCQNEKLFSAVSLDGLNYVGKVNKTSWVCLPVCNTG